MGLFYRRPQCLFCFLFAISSLLAWRLPLSWMVPLLFAVGSLTLLALVLVIARRKNREKTVSLLLALLFILAALLHLFFTVDLPQRQGAELIHGKRVMMEVVAEEQKGYRITILQVDDKTCSMGGHLYVEGETTLSVGDRILCQGELRPTTDLSRYRAEEGILYSVWMEEDEPLWVARVPEDESLMRLLGSSSGRHALAHRIRVGVCSRLTESLGDEVGLLCGGFLMGDTSLLPDETVRDFRRSGVSHLMAISGMHIVLLLGSADWLLRKVYVPKKLRCGIVTLLSLVFLFVTGFASSACRSVLMLFAVYLSYLFGEENDALTALFGSVTVILLLFPYALTDLGLWMSFLATLGLLTVYPLLEKKIPRSKHLPTRFLRKLLLILLMTLVANFFLLPIMWAIFGELSWVAVFSNLPLSPLADLLLVCVLPLLLLRHVPFLGEGLGWLLEAVGELFLFLLRFFSKIPYAVISLRYGFCHILIPLFCISMSVLLIRRLKRKRWLFLPPVATLLVFLVCFGTYHATHRSPRIFRWEMGEQGEILGAEQGITLQILDRTDGGYESYSFAYRLLHTSCATEVQSYTMERYGSSEGVLLLLRRAMVHRLILPTPTKAEEAREAARIYEVAESCGTEVIFKP